MNRLFEEAVALLKKGHDFAYATIISEQGSAPRSMGAKMLITADEIYGSIGGGGMEGEVIALARQEVLESKKSMVKYYNLSGEDVAISDFICGGEQEVLIDYMGADNASHLAIFTEAMGLASSGEKAWLVTALDDSPLAEYPRQFCLVNKKGEITGGFRDDRYFKRAMIQDPLGAKRHGSLGGEQRLVVDAIHTGGGVYLFGAGHVSREVAKITTMVEFQTVVIDDRAEFANESRFPNCQVVVIDSFEDLPKLMVDGDSYILIITRGHMHDRTVLEWALGTKAGYIGMIGSVSKRDKIYDVLRKQGVSQERLDQIYSPVGLAINSETPAEIAVSIVGQLIQVRGEKNKEERHEQGKK